MRKSLFSKIFFTQLIVSLLMIVLIIPTMFVMIGEFFVSTNKETILQDATRVATLTTQISDMSGDENIWNFFRSGIEFAGGQSTVIVTNSDGDIIASPENPTGIDLRKVDERFIKAASEGRTVIQLYQGGGIFSEQTLVAIVPIQKMDNFTNQRRFLGASIAFKPMPQIRHVQNRIVTIIITAQIVAWIVAFIVAFIVTRQILKPVKKMRTAAQNIAKGNFSERIPITSADEIGQLAETFNSMTQSLEELESMRASFISDVSHELRTPMTIISGFIEGVLDGTIPEEEKTKYLGTVLEEVKRLSRLVSELLEASRLEQGKIKIEKTNVDMNRMVAESVFNYEQRLTQKEIEVNLNLQEGQCTASADKDSIKRVLINLIDNAIKFTPERGAITLTTRRDGKKVYVSIENSGEGISQEDLRHIWERFYKTDKSRSHDKKGVGLGLHIVKTIIAQHGGEIYAESQEGKFTRFTFILDEGA